VGDLLDPHCAGVPVDPLADPAQERASF
jgi:hypothetical protein